MYIYLQEHGTNTTYRIRPNKCTCPYKCTATCF